MLSGQNVFPETRVILGQTARLDQNLIRNEPGLLLCSPGLRAPKITLFPMTRSRHLFLGLLPKSVSPWMAAGLAGAEAVSRKAEGGDRWRHSQAERGLTV